MASLESQSRVPIAQLNPNLESADHSSVHGIVTLIWPYNSLTKSLSLLLVEPDFRLRRQQGQVRLQFFGSSAKAVTKAGVSSGDELALSLQGASWEKDAETANTPGRGIAWKVTFGERILLETRHPGQALTTLNIDHPPPSPQLLRKASLPPTSPIYNSHIPNGDGKRKFAAFNDDQPTWSSPAFLKRNHFTLSSQDPFGELDDEFTEYERKKKTKFGRESGQWKFVGTAPSPEREGDDATNQEILLSPSGITQMDTRQDGEEMAMLATPPNENLDSKVDEKSSGSGALESSQLIEKMRSNQAHVFEVEAEEPSKLNDHSSPHDESHPVNPEGDGNQTGPSPSITGQKTSESPPAEPSSQQTGSSVISSKGHSSTSNSENDGPARDSESDAFWSEAASGYGMDGSAMSKVHQAVNISPMANEIGRRWVEMQSRINNTNATERSNQESESKQSIKLREKPSSDIPSDRSHDLPHVSEEPSSKSAAFAPSDPGALMPAVNQGTEAAEMPQSHSDAKDDSEHASLEHADKDDTDETSLTQSTHHEESDRAEELYIQFPDTTSLDKEHEVKKPPILTKNPEAPASVDDDHNDHADPSQATGRDSASPGESLIEPSLAPRTLDVETWTDEGQNAYQCAPDSAEEMLEQSLTSIDNDQKRDLPHQPDHTAEQDSIAQENSLSENMDSLEDHEIENLNDNAVQEDIDSFYKNEEPMDENQISDSSDPNLLETLVSDGGPEDDEINPKVSPEMIVQDSATNAEIVPSQPQFPSTIQDTFDDFSTNQLMNGVGAQQMDLFSQPPASLVPSTLDDEIPSTPNSVHDITDSPVVRDSNIFDSVSEKSYQSQVSNLSAFQEPAEVYDARKEVVSPSYSEKSIEIAEVEPEATDAIHAPSQVSLGQLDKENSPPRKVDEGMESRRGSSLITRLKELRRHSDRTGLERLSSSSASTWFTPRRPDLGSNDEEEGTRSVSKPIEEAKTIADKTTTKIAPEEVEMRLSQSFIRSSPPQSPQSPSILLQESQYIPNSQQTTGFRTSLSYFVPVTSLHCHYGISVDVLAVAVSSTPVSRAPSGPKDHTQTIYITDPSSTLSKDPNSLTTAQIFRPYRTKKASLECFPSIEPGDAILLRDFKVQSFQKSLSLISTDSSAWAVFRKDADVSVPGPPVEYGPEERAFARALWDWWSTLDAAQSSALVAAVPERKLAGAKKATAKKGLGFDLPSSQSKKAAKKSDSNDDIAPNSLREHSTGIDSSSEPDVSVKRGGKAKTPEPQRRVLRPRKGRGMASASPEKEDVPEVEEIHELRDGTRYVDREGVDVEDVEMANGVHDLRDGTRYRDLLRK